MSSSSLLKYLRIRRELCLTEVALLDEHIAHIERTGEPDLDLSAFNPEWKRGTRLTVLGRHAVDLAFERGMRQSEVARLFGISVTRAHELHQKWAALRREQALPG